MADFTLAAGTIPALGIVAVLAGAIDAIAGGGGLITMPALVLAGIPPAFALGTNKLQSVCGTMIASWRYHRAGLWHFRANWPALMVTGLGAAVGATVISRLDGHILGLVVPVLLLGVAAYTMLSPAMTDQDRPPRLGGRAFLPVPAAIGFYDGFFGPGAGQFYATTLVSLRGMALIRATGLTKPLNVASNLASLAIFVAGGHVLWLTGLVMAAGSMSGAVLGSRIATRFGARAIRPLLISVSLALTLKVLANWLGW